MVTTAKKAEEEAKTPEQKQQNIVTKTGKKKIVPIQTQVYHSNTQKIDPSVNPFFNQQLA